jgi:hypothetical protein
VDRNQKRVRTQPCRPNCADQAVWTKREADSHGPIPFTLTSHCPCIRSTQIRAGANALSLNGSPLDLSRIDLFSLIDKVRRLNERGPFFHSPRRPLEAGVRLERDGWHLRGHNHPRER